MNPTTIPSIPNPYEAMLATMMEQFQRLESKMTSLEANLMQVASQTGKEPLSDTVSVTEASKMLSIHRETVLSLLQRGELKAAKGTGKKYLITRQSIHDYIYKPLPEAAPLIRGTK